VLHIFELRHGVRRSDTLTSTLQCSMAVSSCAHLLRNIVTPASSMGGVWPNCWLTMKVLDSAPLFRNG